jgi:hypothetical protein
VRCLQEDQQQQMYSNIVRGSDHIVGRESGVGAVTVVNASVLLCVHCTAGMLQHVLLAVLLSRDQAAQQEVRVMQIRLLDKRNLQKNTSCAVVHGRPS